jgi:hypothetical protein
VSFLSSFLLSFFLPSLLVKSTFYVQNLNYLFMSVLRWRANILWCTEARDIYFACKWYFTPNLCYLIQMYVSLVDARVPNMYVFQMSLILIG